MDYARVLKFPQYFRNLQRLSEIVGVLIKHGFGDLVKRLNLSSYLETGMRVFQIPFAPHAHPLPDLPERMRLVCEELGPTFIKFGQIIATRPDIFPVALTQEFRKLQDNVGGLPFSQIKPVLEAELARPLDQIFTSIDETPLAAASIAQVHRAVLLNGKSVVIKVQRPNLDRIVETDVDILRGLAALVEEHVPESQSYSPVKLIEEFSRSLKRECDFRREAHNLRRFAHNFIDEPGLVIPQVHSTLCTRRILCEDFIDGIRADNIVELHKRGIDGKKIADILTRVVLQSIFEDRFFHADPHAGNVLVTDDNKLALIDFGSMGRLDKVRLAQVLQFLAAILSKNLDRMVRVLREHELVPIFVDEIAFKTEVAEILDNYLGQTLGNLDLAELMSNIFEVVRRYGVKPPPDLMLVGKSLTLLEYLGAQLDPEFSPVQRIQPAILTFYAQHISDPRLYLSYATEVAEEYRKLFHDLPQEVRGILRSITRGELLFNTKVSDLNEIKKHQNKLLNRALMTFVGISLVGLGAAMNTFQRNAGHASVSFLLMAWGAIILVLVWFAIRKTGGTS